MGKFLAQPEKQFGSRFNGSGLHGVWDTVKDIAALNVGGTYGLALRKSGLFPGGGEDMKNSVGNLAAAIAETEKGSMEDGQRIAPQAVQVYLDSNRSMPQVERYIDSELGYSYKGPYSDDVYPWNLIHRHIRKSADILEQAIQQAKKEMEEEAEENESNGGSSGSNGSSGGSGTLPANNTTTYVAIGAGAVTLLTAAVILSGNSNNNSKS